MSVKSETGKPFSDELELSQQKIEIEEVKKQPFKR